MPYPSSQNPNSKVPEGTASLGPHLGGLAGGVCKEQGQIHRSNSHCRADQIFYHFDNLSRRRILQDFIIFIFKYL